MSFESLRVFFSWENGENHLLFNVVPKPEGITELNSDRAIIAGADFNTWSFRTGFDLSIPFLGFNRESFLGDITLTKYSKR